MGRLAQPWAWADLSLATLLIGGSLSCSWKPLRFLQGLSVCHCVSEFTILGIHTEDVTALIPSSKASLQPCSQCFPDGMSPADR